MSGFVRVGDPVTIKFETFPYTLYGTAAGKVRSVSPDSFKDPNDREAAGRVDASRRRRWDMLSSGRMMSIDEVRLHDLPEGARIVPGHAGGGGYPSSATRTVLRYLMSRHRPGRFRRHARAMTASPSRRLPLRRCRARLPCACTEPDRDGRSVRLDGIRVGGR